MPVQLGLFAINYGTCGDPAAAVQVAQAAEAAGFDSVWAGEHAVLPDPPIPRSPLPPETPLLDPIVALTAVAAATSTIRLGTGIVLVPQHNPLNLAKALASLDVVSGGRLLVGIGAGYLRPEFDALGVPYGDRGRRTDDYLAAMRAIWTAAPARHDGPFASFAGVTARPWPVQRPHPPILVGGESPAAFRRAVTAGNGWYGFGLTYDEATEALAALAAAEERYERPAELGPLERSITPVGPFDATAIARYADLGLDRLVLLPKPDATVEERHRSSPLADILRNIEAAADQLRNSSR